MTAGIASAQYRELFPMLRDSTYLVSHSMGAAPLGARAALDEYWSQWAKNGPEAWEHWLPAITRIADDLGTIIGAPPGSIFLGPNVSTLQAALASSLAFTAERNEVVSFTPQHILASASLALERLLVLLIVADRGIPKAGEDPGFDIDRGHHERCVAAIDVLERDAVNARRSIVRFGHRVGVAERFRLAYVDVQSPKAPGWVRLRLGI